jgi:O-antigen/teichoic acid export membrane protein
MAADAGDHKFVFVGGLHGSGTSRVASMLGLHRLVSAPRAMQRPGHEGEDVRLFEGPLAQADPDNPTVSGAAHLTEASPHSPPESAEQLLQSWRSYWDLSRQVLVESSAQNLLRARFLQGLFPGAYFIMIMRHPIAVIEAGRKRPSSGRSSRLEQWVTVHEAMADDIGHLDRVLVVRYEDLLTGGDSEYRRMLEFLDLPWAPAVTDLDLSGNDAYYRSFTAGRPLARMAARKAVRDFGTRVERFGYRMRPPHVVATPELSALAWGSPGRTSQAGAEATSPAVVPARATAPALATSRQPPTAAEPAVESAAETAESAAAPPEPANVASLGSRAVDEAGDTRARGELRTAARGGFALTIGIAVAAVFQFGFLTLAAHKLDQSDIGAVLEAIAIFTICNNAAELGADTGLFRFAPIFHRRRPQDVGRLHVVALVPVLVASTVAAVLVFLFAPQLAHVFVHHVVHKGTATALRILACFLPAVTLTTVISAALRAWTLRVPLVVNLFLLPIARPMIFAGLLLVGVTVKLTIIAWAAPTAVGFIVVSVALASRIRHERTDPDAPVSSYGEVASEFWRFSLPRTFAAILQILILSLDVLLVGAFLSARYAAAYSVASRYVIYGTFGLQAVVGSVTPQMSRLMDAREYGAVQTVYKSSTCWTVAASWPLLLALAIFAPLFLSVFGHGYVIASSALTILALAMLANTGTGPNGAILQMAGRSGVILVIQAISLAINIGLNVWLIPRIGLVGAAIAWLASIAFMVIVTAAILWRNYRFEPFGTGYAITAGAALACYGVLGLAARLAFGRGVVTFLLYAVVSSVLYGLVLFRWRDKLDLDAFESVYGGVVRRARTLRATIAGGRRATRATRAD